MIEMIDLAEVEVFMVAIKINNSDHYFELFRSRGNMTIRIASVSHFLSILLVRITIF